MVLDELEEREQLVDRAPRMRVALALAAPYRPRPPARAAGGRALRGPGGGAVGTGIGRLASLLAVRRLALGSDDRPPLRAARWDLRLTAPFTGRRSTKTQPTFGTGLPPISRPSSNSHG